MNKNKRGISLIVLVITIIVIIILAAAVILTINNNNPMDNANKARYTSDRANVQNALSTAIGKIAADKQCSVTIPAQDNIAGGIGYTLTGASDGTTKGKIGWETLATVSSGEEATTILEMKMPNYGSNTRWFINSNGDVSVQVAGVTYGPGGTNLQPGVPASGNTNYTVDGKTAVIPNGFSVSTIPEEQSIDGGLVVKAPDATASEFVWVPVDNVNDMFSKPSETSLTYVGNLREYTKNGDLRGSAITQTDNGFREPDKLTDTLNGDTNANVATMMNILNLPVDKELKTGDDLKKFMEEEVNAIYASIQKNKGFYIGRYETGDLSKDQVVSNKDNSDISDKTWYEMYAKQKKYGTLLAKGVKSNMIYGSQWDAVMRWFAADLDTETGIEIARYVIDATGKGNWNNSSSIPTGVYKEKNIYDMAGNVWDWTAEVYSSDCRVFRGGRYSYPVYGQCAGYRAYDYPTSSDVKYGSRLALYL